MEAIIPYPTNQFTIRYRCDDPRGRTALIVEDNAGAAYLFTGGHLQGRLRGTNASARLARRLASNAEWQPIPRVAPYTLDGLREITEEGVASSQ